MFIQPRDTECPACQTDQITFDATYGFYECEFCDNKWGYPEDDPDYAEAEDYPEIMEQVYEADPRYWAPIQEERTG